MTFSGEAALALVTDFLGAPTVEETRPAINSGNKAARILVWFGIKTAKEKSTSLETVAALRAVVSGLAGIHRETGEIVSFLKLKGQQEFEL